MQAGACKRCVESSEARSSPEHDAKHPKQAVSEIRSATDLVKSLSRSPQPLIDSVVQLRDLFAEQGFLVVKGLLSVEQAEAMRDQALLPSEWESKAASFDPAMTWLQSSLLENVHRASKLVRDYYWRGPLVDVAEALIGPNIKGVTSQFTFKLRGNTKSFAWHQDNGYGELDPYNAISCLTALDDADEENGCLRLVPKSHKRGQLRSLTAEQKASGAEITIDDVDESAAIPVPMRTGDVLIMHCHTLHASGPNTSDRHRRMLFLRYADADAVEVYNARRPRPGRLLRGLTRFTEVSDYEASLD